MFEIEEQVSLTEKMEEEQESKKKKIEFENWKNSLKPEEKKQFESAFEL